MKKIVTGLSITLFILVIAFTAFAQKNDKKDNKKEQPQSKQQDKQTDKGNKNQDKKAGKNDDRGNDKNKGNDKKDKGNNGNDDDGSNGKNKDKDNGKNDNGNNSDGYSWNKGNFKERKKLRNQEKVTICHKFNSNNEPAVTINVSSNALKAHMNHGDVQGDCPTVADKRFSDDYLRRRAAYYNDLQNTQEQVLYSRSILDYAVERLTNSRLQLTTLRNNNVAVVEIQRKEAVIVQLERNVSLLETVLGVAANIVVQKLTN
jgi:hypothetical protein